MFLIPTYLGRSPIHGIGVFTPVALPANTIIWEFSPDIDWRLSPDELERFPEPYQDKLRMYCYLEASGLYVFCGDNAKYMNHSFEPNCDDPEGRYTITNRDIEANEELTCDYRNIDMESAQGGLDQYLTASNHEPSSAS
mgnify:CR=1 FL=1